MIAVVKIKKPIVEPPYEKNILYGFFLVSRKVVFSIDTATVGISRTKGYFNIR